MYELLGVPFEGGFLGWRVTDMLAGMTDKITLEELAGFMTRQLPATYDVFEKNRADDAAFNQASWARGRVDAFLQLMQVIDSDREQMLRAEWERVVTGKGFLSNDEDE